MPGSVGGIVFDLDGTLVDSRLDFPAMRADTGCPEGTGLLEFIEQMETAAEREAAHAVIHRYETAGAERASWIDGAQAVLEKLVAARYPIGIFTRNSRETATLMIESLGIPCDDLVAREDAAAKPDPEGLLKIAERWQLPAGNVMCVGDFLYDLQAAHNAGMSACLYDPAGDSPHAGHADYVIHDFAELADMIFGEQQ
jgi:HAD superfamily hydrolase (TIGR01509 family)